MVAVWQAGRGSTMGVDSAAAALLELARLFSKLNLWVVPKRTTSIQRRSIGNECQVCTLSDHVGRSHWQRVIISWNLFNYYLSALFQTDHHQLPAALYLRFVSFHISADTQDSQDFRFQNKGWIRILYGSKQQSLGLDGRPWHDHLQASRAEEIALYGFGWRNPLARSLTSTLCEWYNPP